MNKNLYFYQFTFVFCVPIMCPDLPLFSTQSNIKMAWPQPSLSLVPVYWTKDGDPCRAPLTFY